MRCHEAVFLLLAIRCVSAFVSGTGALTFSFRGGFGRIPFDDAVARIHSPELVARPANASAPYRRLWADAVDFRCNDYDVRMWTSNPDTSNLRFTRGGRTVLRARVRVAPLSDGGHTLKIVATLYAKKCQHAFISRLVPLVVAVQQVRYERGEPALAEYDPNLDEYRRAVMSSVRGLSR